MKVINKLPDTPTLFQRPSIVYGELCDMYEVNLYIHKNTRYTIRRNCNPGKVYCWVMKYENEVYIEKGNFNQIRELNHFKDS